MISWLAAIILVLLVPILVAPFLMPLMARTNRSHKDRTKFAIRKYYFEDKEECPKCPRSTRPIGKHYHCAKCHKNKEFTENWPNRYLKRHYIDTKEHSLSEPPRTYVPIDFASLSDDDKVTVSEGVFAYMAVTESISFRAFDFINRFVQSCFNENFRLSPTKCAAIVKQAYAKWTDAKTRAELADAKYLTISFDGSIVHHQKLLPIFGSFYQDRKLKHRLLAIHSLDDEKAKTIEVAIRETIDLYGIRRDQLVAICADNCRTNYGSEERTGTGNVFAMMKGEYGDKLIGIGCLAHVLHNSVKHGCKVLDMDIEWILYKLPKYFENSNKANEFMELCDSLDRHCELPAKYVQTRWLTMSRTLESIIPAFDMYRQFFGSLKGKVSAEEQKYKAFFADKKVHSWLELIQASNSTFGHSICTKNGNLKPNTKLSSS